MTDSGSGGGDRTPFETRARDVLEWARSRVSIRSLLASRLGMDARAIATFRVLLGATLLFNVLHRTADLQAFYTDQGVLPRSLLYADSSWTVEYSVHALSGSGTFQAILFAVTGALAVALLVGYRPQLAALLVAGLVVSLHLRNPYVLNAGDRLLHELLALAVFLPLAERWAIRPRRTKRTLVATPATAALLVYVVVIFFGNALEKRRGDTWPTGEALDYALRQDHMTILLGNHLAEYPTLLELGTYGWFGLLLSSPLLLVTADRLRLVHCLAFLGAVTGLGLSVAVGLFPPLLMAAIVLFLPARFWDGAERGGVALRRRIESRVDHPPMLGRIAASLESAARRLGSRVGPIDDSLDEAIGRASTPVVRRLARDSWSIILVILLVFVSSLSVGMLGWAEPFEPVEEFDAEDYTWGVYAPNPSDSYVFWTVEAERAEREPVDVLREKPLSTAPPPDPASTFPSFRWRKYMYVLHDDDHATAYRAAFTDYMCERANERFDGTTTSVTVTYTRTRIAPGGELDSTTIELTSRECTTS